ncbi:hypothetical protein BJ322DRAFT_1107483 [Thelephora terrestris]|uniref:DUF6589 domain-containing protein n=1 Tax=Thelephora terrestris TaxID=56493 RepID=A0A9P6HIK9_9AGAM|nr:hypothetical protein BJ322DRAFT_1107483 [Thelephora terrestris]
MDLDEPGAKPDEPKGVQAHMTNRRNAIGGDDDLKTRVSAVLNAVTEDSVAKYQRSLLMNSVELPQILDRWKKSKSARTRLETHALNSVGGLIKKEMDMVVDHLRCAGEDLTEDNLASVTEEEMVLKLKPAAPTLWKILKTASQTGQQEKRNKSDRRKRLVFMICQLAFSRNHNANQFHKFLTVYLKACGLPAKALDTLSSLGLTMSQKWAFQGIDTLAEHANKELRRQIHDLKLLFLFSHDNINRQFRVFEQRVDRQTTFDSGTASTIYLIPGTENMRLDNRALQEQRKIGRANPITARDVVKLSMLGAERVTRQMEYKVLCFLLNSPDFDVDTYKHRGEVVLDPPPPVQELPCGRENQTIQYMLPTAHICESTYEGNDQVISETYKYLGLDSLEEMKETGLNRVIVWAGDQLTVSRLQGLVNFRSHDDNSFERMDYLIPSFGWFHLQMAFATSLHSQYYGKKGSYGFSHAFDIMGKKGLANTATQGTFHYAFEEALKEVATARFRDLWKQVAGVEELNELRDWEPDRLVVTAKKIYGGFASTSAVVELRSEEEDSQDQLLKQMAQFNRDLLEYLELDTAIKMGDVGRIEDMLPRLLLRFVGGRNNKYAIEVLELLQGLNREWSDNIKEFVRTRGWLVNNSGRRDGFYPIDLGQEHGVRDIKHTFDSAGPGVTWEYIKRISAAIPTLRKVKDHFQYHWNNYLRYGKHSSPTYENDITLLRASYNISEIHVKQKGEEALASGKVIQKWHKRRERNVSEKQLWSESESEDILFEIE